MNQVRNFLSITVLLLSSSVYAQGSKETIDYVEEYKKIAVKEMHRVGIPASITLAQGILESSYGKSRLATEGNNHFGIKCHKNWVGPVMFYDDDERDECFRVYDSPTSSFLDHSDFLTSRDRYAFLFDLKRKNYKGWAKGLKKAGYATAKDYADKLIGLIERYDLSQYDSWKLKQLAPLDYNDAEIVQEAEEVESVVSSVQKVKILRHPNNIKYVQAEDGESIKELAQRVGVWEWELIRYNEINEDYIFLEGEDVFIQPKRKRSRVKTYIIREGETLFSISQKFGIKQRYILLRNNFRTEFEIRPGVELVLRGKK